MAVGTWRRACGEVLTIYFLIFMIYALSRLHMASGFMSLCCIISLIIDKQQHSFIFSKSVEECVAVALNERTLKKKEKSSPLHTIVFCMALKALHNSSQIVVHKRHI